MRKALFISLFLGGCATQSHMMRGPNGKTAFSISCKRGIENCYKEASLGCPNGYNLISQGQSTRGIVSTGYALVPVSSDNIFVECK
jgi:hypothetical protein